ncbi:MAG: hypothetical protein KDD27_23720 [Saprospiraceae bacterium]|nr:hypothetical protein [Saprospiraceae bacterium]
MKIIRTNLIFTFILILILLGCKKDDECFKAIGINGEWIWVESVGGFGGWTLTPESESITKKLIIDDFFYKEFVNDSLVLETEYELGISEETLLGTEERTFIKFDSGGEQAIIIEDSELELIDQCFDCFNHRYRRN